MILLGFRHGLHVPRLCTCSWDQVHLDTAGIEMRRAKKGKPCPARTDQDRDRALHKLSSAKLKKGLVFTTEDGGPMHERSFHLIMARAGRLSGLGFPAHPHQFRHACGHYLAAKGLNTRESRITWDTSRSSTR